MVRWVLALGALSLFLVLDFSRAGGTKAPKPVNLGKVNTKADEDDPFVLGRDLLYASNARGKFAIMISRKVGADWPAGKVFRELEGKDTDYRSPFYFPRDNKLFFATNLIPDEKEKDRRNYDLKFIRGESAHLPLLGISEPEDELHPWVTPAGKEFYFSRKTDKGFVLFRANGPIPGPIGDAKAVGLPTGFHHASLSSSGLIMYLQGPLDKDRVGLFRTRRAKVGAAWAKPEPIVNLNNPEGPRGDMSPCLSSDGSRLYFASDRPGGKGGLDLWSVDTAPLKTEGIK